MVTKIDFCRCCHGDVSRRLLLSPAIFPSLFTESQEPPNEWPLVPLDLVECEKCNLVQLRHSFSADEMYRHYWYLSSMNHSMVSALRDIVSEASKTIVLRPGDAVLDIGCNDGTLLRCYRDLGLDVYRIGYDPGINLGTEAARNCEQFINDYFYSNPTKRLAKVITAIAMFYDLEDPAKFVADVSSWLAEDGIFIIQMTDLVSMMRVNALDNICHEHLEYWTLKGVMSLLESAGLQVFRVSTNSVNGASVRLFCCRQGSREIERSVQDYLSVEMQAINWPKFVTNCGRAVAAIKSFLRTAKADGKTVAAIGASTKGNTLLQLVSARGYISMIGEVSKSKFGRFAIGTGIPIVPEDEMLSTNPDYVLMLPWHFKESLLPKLHGRQVVLPLPIPKINEEVLW